MSGFHRRPVPSNPTVLYEVLFAFIMNSGRLVAIASALISLAALAIAISEFEGIMTVIALFSLVFGSVASKRCSAKTNLFILAAAIATLACTVVSVVALGPEQMVDKDVMDKVHWFYIMGLLHAVPIVPMAFASFIIIASVTGASYNWAVVGGLSPFVALGILVPGYVLEYVFQGIGDLLDDNGYILYGLLVVTAVMLVFSWIFARFLRRNRLIVTETGIVPLDYEPESPAPACRLTPSQDIRERRTALAVMALAPVALMVICWFVVTGKAPGLAAGHPEEYLVATCVLWALISLILPILRLTRLVSLPSALVGIIYANIFFYVICLTCGLYLNVSWCGDFGHVVSSTIVSTIVFVALCLIQTNSPSHVTFGSVAGFCSMLFLVSLSFGGIWEMMEGFTDTATGYSYMVYGATDTMGDLSADLVGVILVTLAAHSYLRKHTTEDMASKVRIGRSSFLIDESD